MPGEVPEHLLRRSVERRRALGLPVPGEDDAPTAEAAPAEEAPAEGPAAQAPAAEAPAEAQVKVHVWPHLLVGEFVSLLSLMALVTIFSALVRAPLLEQANFNQTPNPSKAPWYFLGLQELLTIWHPMVAGVTIPGMGLI